MPNIFLRLMALAFLSVAATHVYAQERIHYTLLEEPRRALPKKLLIVPADVQVREMSAGGVIEKVPEWTEKASQNLTDALRATTGERKDMELVPLPQLTEEERDQLDQYLATYMVVGSAAHNITRIADPAWEHKRRRFDYTLGAGLGFLQEKSGADAAIMVVGDDVVSSSGRKVAFFLAAMAGVGIPLGASLVSLGIVDLRTGDILWMHHTNSVSTDLKEPEGAKAMVNEILVRYPGLPTAAR